VKINDIIEYVNTIIKITLLIFEKSTDRTKASINSEIRRRINTKIYILNIIMVVYFILSNTDI
jgi:hypothetical protein